MLALVLALTGALAAAGCDSSGTRIHTVSEVRETFAGDGLRLSILSRNRVSTTLLPTWYVRALKRTPTLGTPPRPPNYQVVVFTDRSWLRNLARHWREAQATLGGPSTPMSDVSMKRDNVVIFYVRGPANRRRLARVLDDI
jgi:hypothetical protein